MVLTNLILKTQSYANSEHTAFPHRAARFLKKDKLL